ncbi:MAG: hypothetical protein U0903_05055 [Planctomycetales bacterium]
MTTESQSQDGPQTWRHFLARETFEYFLNFTFLALFLVAFAWYRRLILAAYHIQYTGYWMPVIEAAILAKLIMLGEAMHIGQRFRTRPLAFVTVYRTVVFSLFVGLFLFIEHIADAMIHGKSAADGLDAIAKIGKDELLGSTIMTFAAFLPFFAMKEIERAFGAEKVRSLFFRGHANEADNSRT